MASICLVIQSQSKPRLAGRKDPLEGDQVGRFIHKLQGNIMYIAHRLLVYEHFLSFPQPQLASLGPSKIGWVLARERSV